MTTGMVKSPPKEEIEITSVEHQEEAPKVYLIHGVPVDMLDYFCIDIPSLTENAKRQMSDIYEMLKGKNVIEELSALERKFGQPSGNETRYGKVWHWMKLNRRIKGE